MIPKENKNQAPMEVPASALSSDALANLIESFILREGTDYGAVEMEHGKKVLRIEKMLESGLIKIAFDPNTESVTLMTEQDWRQSVASLKSNDY